MTDNADDAQTLRLLRAFMKIEDLDARRIIIRLTEAAASGASINVENFDLASEMSKLN